MKNDFEDGGAVGYQTGIDLRILSCDANIARKACYQLLFHMLFELVFNSHNGALEPHSLTVVSTLHLLAQ